MPPGVRWEGLSDPLGGATPWEGLGWKSRRDLFQSRAKVHKIIFVPATGSFQIGEKHLLQEHAYTKKVDAPLFYAGF